MHEGALEPTIPGDKGYYTLSRLNIIAETAAKKMPGKVITWRVVIKKKGTYLEVLTAYEPVAQDVRWNARCWVKLGGAEPVYSEISTGQWGF